MKDSLEIRDDLLAEVERQDKLMTTLTTEQSGLRGQLMDDCYVGNFDTLRQRLRRAEAEWDMALERRGGLSWVLTHFFSVD